ncbi:MFS transporter [Paenibacillus polymyxa]|uniref:MFS transporter n=1 Tax=Paenibacillus polymyxa TaxID=1406 RepID=UPI002019090A|nr:glycoside-pentoside-hexuronide (GPH):cation symporter [Paenibacillus polymyxa]MDU8671309.1 glycoside-pentoside-hexuronide (GPH):cation symporter [Paenibacillus polymyxa]MDU8696219.1 glycoside-pentoside-hexuronide (GPH):cation symporter [Paenibacillus polymyxa]MEE4579548.1 glycoside-pentoside-hexuronide (GPH):cation symporter [Paenibacillus polymyxa]UQQ37625.1 glycoside-pentoside-hexuronide (GPH):cation symporter [Paenibacillus polymyxa]URJ55446.1 glycoside-pentoside-hexuronide (GPH):cation 
MRSSSDIVVRGNEASVQTGSIITLKEKIGYGFGDFASQLLFAAAMTFLSYFYTDVIGISAGVIGTLMLVARVLDAFIDVAIGALIDKTKSRHGKARPWLLWMSGPFALSGILLFTVPSGNMTITILYIYVTYLLMNFIYSSINVPYGVLNSMITQDSYQRSLLNIFRMSLANIGALLINYFTLPLVKSFGGGQKGWIFTFIIFGLLGTFLFLVTFFSTKERVTPSVVQKPIPFGRAFGALMRNKYWKLILGFAVVYFINNALGTGMNIYYARYVLKDANLIGVLGISLLLPSLLGYMLLPPIVKRIGKRNSSIIGSILLIVGSLVISVSPISLMAVCLGLVIKALGHAAILGTFFAMLADTIEYGEWKTGMRTEGLVYSAGSFGTKAGGGLGAALIGWGLALGGYAGGQATISATALASIHFMFIYVPIILALLQILLLVFYNLDKLFPGIVKELEFLKNAE